jgi:hypothetical protein
MCSGESSPVLSLIVFGLATLACCNFQQAASKTGFSESGFSGFWAIYIRADMRLAGRSIPAFHLIEWLQRVIAVSLRPLSAGGERAE